ncbi:YjbH domain-containing protein [Deltaproteobacteria bacterium]|nr:YjbH domain-containing protein [Deltaproteobacteria bacterium]
MADNYGSGSIVFSPIRDYTLLFLILLSSFFLIQLIIVPHTIASDHPFNNAANWGGTGLMEIPNARILGDGVVRVGAAQALPYRWYTGGMGILPGIEFTGRLSEMTNIPALGPGYGANKDKAFDLKYQILPESKEMPAIAIGINDFWGTRLFPGEYLVISRQYYPFDITLGIGSKRLKSSVSLPFLDDFGIFGGIELALNERLHLMAEYNPIEYEKDIRGARAVPEGAKSPINFGIRARLLAGINLGLSYQRGNTFGMSLHFLSELGEPVLPHRADHPPLVSVDRRPFNDRDQKNMIEKIHEAIHDADFSAVAVYSNGSDLIAEFENTKYLSNQKAVGRVLRILLFNSPSNTKLLTAVLKKSDIPILKISVKPDHLEKYLLGEIPDDIFFEKLMKIQITKHAVETQDGQYIQTEKDKTFKLDYSIKPDLDIYWNDPSGFFKYNVAMKPYVTANLWKGASAFFRYSVPLYSNIYSPSTESLPPDVVMSDISKYLVKDDTIDRLLVNQNFRISEKSFGRLSLGYFNNMYAGIGGETIYFPGEGKMAFGIEGDWLRKRAPETQFELMDVKKYSLLGNAYYYYQGLDMTFHAQYGRFLAGDVGWMFDISRQYSTGAILGMYISFTDTKDIEPRLQ